LYAEKLKRYDITTSQILITYHNLQDEKEEKNIENRIKDDIANKIVPLINYNDCIDDRGIVLYDSNGNLEIRDNDMLASAIAGYINASRLVILTNSNSSGTTGGRETKEKAISMANDQGIEVVVGEYSKGLYNLVTKN
jgi:glutamate 5-kinase